MLIWMNNILILSFTIYNTVIIYCYICLYNAHLILYTAICFWGLSGKPVQILRLFAVNNIYIQYNRKVHIWNAEGVSIYTESWSTYFSSFQPTPHLQIIGDAPVYSRRWADHWWRAPCPPPGQQHPRWRPAFPPPAQQFFENIPLDLIPFPKPTNPACTYGYSTLGKMTFYWCHGMRFLA